MRQAYNCETGAVLASMRTAQARDTTTSCITALPSGRLAAGSRYRNRVAVTQLDLWELEHPDSEEPHVATEARWQALPHAPDAVPCAPTRCTVPNTQAYDADGMSCTCLLAAWDAHGQCPVPYT